MKKTKRKKAKQVLVHPVPGRASCSGLSFPEACRLSPVFGSRARPSSSGSRSLENSIREDRCAPSEQVGGQQVASSSFKSLRCDILADMEISCIFFLIATLDATVAQVAIYIQALTALQKPLPGTTGAFSFPACA